MGLRDLTIPHIAYGPDLVKVLAPEGFGSAPNKSCCGTTVSIDTLRNPDELVREASLALASIKLHGRK